MGDWRLCVCTLMDKKDLCQFYAPVLGHPLYNRAYARRTMGARLRLEAWLRHQPYVLLDTAHTEFVRQMRQRVIDGETVVSLPLISWVHYRRGMRGGIVEFLDTHIGERVLILEV